MIMYGMIYDGYDLWLTHKIVSLKQLELSANTCIPNEVADVNILTAVVLDWLILLVLFFIFVYQVYIRSYSFNLAAYSEKYRTPFGIWLSRFFKAMLKKRF